MHLAAPHKIVGWTQRRGMASVFGTVPSVDELELGTPADTAPHARPLHVFFLLQLSCLSFPFGNQHATPPSPCRSPCQPQIMHFEPHMPSRTPSPQSLALPRLFSHDRKAYHPAQTHCLPSFRFKRGTKAARRPDFLAICNEPKRDQGQDGTHSRQEGARPGDAQARHHVLDGQRQERAGHAPRHAHCRQGRG